MLQLKNNTPFAAATALFPNEQGIETLYTIVKANLVFFPKLALAPEQTEPQKKDEYSGEPGHSSLVYASDFHTGKAGTDIVMTGSAFSREGQEVRQLDVSLQVADLYKVVRVYGDRIWERGRITQAQLFSQMPLTYEHAFGGTLLVDGEVHETEERNPVGLGFTGDLKEMDIETWPLPNLESPVQPIQNFGARPAPACFAPIAPHWRPRANFAGTYDEHWQRTRAPYLPDDYQPRFNNCVPDDQIYNGFLRGGEPISISGMHPMGDLNFNLPQVNIINRIQVQTREVVAPFQLETIHLRPNELQVSMVWRSAVPCDKHARKIRQITVNMSR